MILCGFLIYLEVYIQALCMDEEEINPFAANTRHATGCCGAKSCIMDRSRHAYIREQLKVLGAPKSHHRVREVS